MTTSNRDAALYYATRLGWHVLPVWPTVGARCACPLGEACGSNAGKHPLVIPGVFERGLSQASRAPDDILRWWGLRPDASVAVAMRVSGLVAFDVDLYKGDLARLAGAAARLGALPDTVEQRSGSGEGAHLIYRAPDHAVRGAIDGVTLRSRNYLVVAPSAHRSGNRYAWEPGAEPWSRAVAALPEPWLAAIRAEDRVASDVGIPALETEPAWLQAVPRERRVAEMRAHLAREKGEQKGISPPGTGWSVCRSVARGYAVRDPEDVRRAVLEIYDPKCAPPYGPERVARNVEKGYDASEPPWGAYFAPPAIDPDLIAAIQTSAAAADPYGPGPAPASPARGRCLYGAELVALVQSRVSVPWVTVTLAGRELVTVRAGGIILLIGGSGKGKTSLALAALLDHAAHDPAIGMSLELPVDEFAGRAIGAHTGQGWADVLRGVAPNPRLPDRFGVIGRQDASLALLAAEIYAIRAAMPGASPDPEERKLQIPVLVAIDYVQLMDSAERDVRRAVADAMKRIDAFARGELVVVIALSQGSRGSAKALSSGEKLGAETSDAGAEAAELERWSTTTVAIGEQRPRENEAVADVDVSVGKSRMGQGDRVVPMAFDGRSGAWSITGEAQTAADVREARLASKGAAKVEDLLSLILAALRQSDRPMSRQELSRSLARRKADIGEAIARALSPTSEIVEMNYLAQGGARPVWTRAQAAAANLLEQPRAPGMPAQARA